MEIDNPLDQAIAQIEAEKRDRNPAIERFAATRPFLKFGKAAFGALAIGDLSGCATALREFSDIFAHDRSEYLLGVVISELRALWEKFTLLDSRHQEYLDRNWLTLFLDADKKARETTTGQKIARIGKILSSAAYSPRPLVETEEFTRIAMSLDEGDVHVLRIIFDHQGKMIRPEFGRVRGYDAYSIWPAVCSVAKSAGLVIGDLEAICGKLESFGLITRSEGQTNPVADHPTPFALLQRGAAFLQAAQFSSSAEIPAD